MSLDISHILRDWPYEPGRITARRIVADDGRGVIQLRLELGLYQMEVAGRPDGKRPHGQENLLAHYEHLHRQHLQKTGGEQGFELDEGDCEQLRTEASMYYHRYLAEFILEDYAAVERDTLRNLRAMDFCRRFAKEESDRHLMEQYRPYVIMMCTRARALMAFGQNRPKAALSALRRGLEDIRRFFRRFGQEQAFGDSSEVAVLQAMIKEIESHIPEDPIRKLRRDLAKAVQEERYEDAASLRDQLRSIRQAAGPQRPGP